jgi:hypothetical protein
VSLPSLVVVLARRGDGTLKSMIWTEEDEDRRHGFRRTSVARVGTGTSFARCMGADGSGLRDSPQLAEHDVRLRRGEER